MAKKKWFSRTRSEERHSLTATRLYTSIMAISSRRSLTRRSSISSRRPKPSNQHSRTPCKYLNLPTSSLRSICRMAWNRSNSQMERLSPFTRMVKRKVFSLTVQFRKLIDMAARQLNILTEKETYFCQMVLASTNNTELSKFDFCTLLIIIMRPITFDF